MAAITCSAKTSNNQDLLVDLRHSDRPGLEVAGPRFWAFITLAVLLCPLVSARTRWGFGVLNPSWALSMNVPADTPRFYPSFIANLLMRQDAQVVVRFA